MTCMVQKVNEIKITEKKKIVQKMEKREHHTWWGSSCPGSCSLTQQQAAKQRNGFLNSLPDCQKEVQLVDWLKELFG